MSNSLDEAPKSCYRGTDPSFQNSVFTSYADELNSLKEYYDIMIDQLTRFINEKERKLAELEEESLKSISDTFPSVAYDPLSSIPHFKTNYIMLFHHSLDKQHSKLLMQSLNEPIKPQFNVLEKDNNFQANNDIGKFLRNVVKISNTSNKFENEVNPNSYLIEPRKTIHKKMELFERNEKSNNRLIPTNGLKKAREDFFLFNDKTINESTLEYSHTSKIIVPNFWPQRSYDGWHRLSPDNSDSLFRAISAVIQYNSRDASKFRKKKRERVSRISIPLNDSSTESSGYDTDYSDPEFL